MTTTGTDEQSERELKFDIADDWELPDPARLAPPGGTVEREVVHLETTYFDTAARGLLHHRLTLRRRTGDIDAGWQLKVPDGDARLEIRAPLGGRGVPEELRTATLGVRARAALAPLATLITDREIHRLLDADGSTLAEIVVDSVTSTETLEFAVTRHWREVEVELQHGDEQLLARAAKWLAKQGATPSGSGSKLARALDVELVTERNASRLSGLIGRYLDRQYEALVRGDIDLRRGKNAIHAVRVAGRRYRSVLRIYGPLLDTDRAVALDAELKWYAGALGEVRDRHVLQRHLDAVLADLPPDLVVGAVSDRIDETLMAEQAQAEADLAALMRSRRYVDLLTELRDWQLDLPIRRDQPAGRAKRFVERAEKKARHRLRAADQRLDGTDEALHRARKAAKRARYAAELSRPELGSWAQSAAKRMKKTQRRLGEHQDGVVAAEFLRRLGTGGHDIGFTLGLLYERERARGRPHH